MTGVEASMYTFFMKDLLVTILYCM